MNSDDITGISPQKNDPPQKKICLLVQADGRTDQGGNLGMDEWKGEYLYGDCIYVWEIANRHVDIYTSIYTRQRCFFACICICMHMSHAYVHTHIHIYVICTYVRIYIYICIYINIKMKNKTYAHVNTLMSKDICTCKYIYTYNIYTYAHLQLHLYIYIIT
jgi:hypothetical protein